MIRMETETGWWLVTHPDHARLAGQIAERWGNEVFARPEPRASVLLGISAHDDGWAVKDSAPAVTRQGKPAAFSRELVGRYSAFEEIDLAEYLGVRERAGGLVEERDAYAGLLVSLHTYNLLTDRADRATIREEQLPLLDAFLERQRARQGRLMKVIQADGRFREEETTEAAVKGNFRLLQAADNLSLLACVAYEEPATLLHALAGGDGQAREVVVTPAGVREFRLKPYPLDAGELRFRLPARFVGQKEFRSAEELKGRFEEANLEDLEVVVRG